MLYRCASLDEALVRVSSGAMGPDCRVVVSQSWWDELSDAARLEYRTRCDEAGARLSEDDRLSRHFVEVSAGGEAPLTSERRV